MVDATHISFPANDRSYFSLLKKEIHKKAAEAGIGQERLNAIDIIVAEMTSNLFKYATGGEILLGVFKFPDYAYVELICIDNGPGILNPQRMLKDGVSTSNTLGHGLGSIKRMSDSFEIFSQIGWGTIVLSRVYSASKPNSKLKDALVHPLVVAKPGETTSGDGFTYKLGNNYIKVMLADGLGHGPEANHAVNEAAKAFRIFPEYSPIETLRFIHHYIKKTRGAVINVLAYDYTKNHWSIAGIGNISARLCGLSGIKNHMSYNGIVGHNIPTTMHSQEYSRQQFNQVILCSDGIKSKWDMARYGQLQK
ncbi:serine/threonine protein kinase, partial [Pseudoxanthomonas sp. SGD-10]